MNKLIILFVLLALSIAPPPCGKLDIRRRYVVVPICEPQPVKPIAPITFMH